MSTEIFSETPTSRVLLWSLLFQHLTLHTPKYTWTNENLTSLAVDRASPPGCQIHSMQVSGFRNLKSNANTVRLCQALSIQKGLSGSLLELIKWSAPTTNCAPGCSAFSPIMLVFSRTKTLFAKSPDRRNTWTQYHAT